MADQPMQGGYTPEQDYSVGSLANWAGAAVSLALVVGVGVWGYQLLARDVSGVPVVRAVSGAMREEPKNPGGLPAAHQGLSVNDVAAGGLAADPADQIILAPPPINLDAEDTPMRPLAVATQTVTGQQAVTPQGDLSGQMNDQQRSSIQALADQLAAGSQPLGTVEEAQQTAAPLQEAALQPVETTTVSPRVEGGIGRSLRPRARPVGLMSSAASDTVARAAIGTDAVAQGEIDPASVPAGTRLAQLGAYASRDIALSEWDRLNGKFGEYLDGKSRVIQKATSGGRVFYRLRAMGFADLSDARRFCSALLAEKADCIPVVTR